jgi:hypothetical protein
VLLALSKENNWNPDIVYFGGQFAFGWVNTTASNQAWRIRVGATLHGSTADQCCHLPAGRCVVRTGLTLCPAPDPLLCLCACRHDTPQTTIRNDGQHASDYNFNGGWIKENMLSPRVMPDAVILPNGHVVVMNGAKVRAP